MKIHTCKHCRCPYTVCPDCQHQYCAVYWKGICPRCRRQEEIVHARDTVRQAAPTD